MHPWPNQTRPHPPRPAPPQGFLIQKIIACEKRSIPCLCAEWCFDACGTGCIQSVSACGTPCWTVENGCTLRVSIPLSVRLCDSCGRCFSKSASLDVETDLPHHFVCQLEEPRNTLLILPCVRLVHAECSCNGCFRVQLAVSLDLFLLRYETCQLGGCKPQCPQLPLYPPPVC